MPKFYVQCGPCEVVLQADDASSAALQAIDRVLQNHLWIYDDEGLTDNDRRTHLMLESLMHLDPAIRVSERGFDREDAQLIGTPDTVQHWHEFMTGMQKLFVIAGLAPRSIHEIAGMSSAPEDGIIPIQPR
ncbi:MAG: hypothetical protein AAF664_07420 [Planctomycetota bacterium]